MSTLANQGSAVTDISTEVDQHRNAPLTGNQDEVNNADPSKPVGSNTAVTALGIERTKPKQRHGFAARGER